MNPRPDHRQAGERSGEGISTRNQPPTATIRRAPWLRAVRWFPGLVAVPWVFLFLGFPLHGLRNASRLARTELVHLLQMDKADPASVLAAFDRATEEVLFAASGPCLILAVATVFLVAQLVAVRRRLRAAELDIQVLRDVVRGV